MSSIKLVLLGWLRHTIGGLGLLLVAKGYLGAEAKDAFVAKAVEEAFGALMVAAAYGWSAFDKTLVIGWIRQAFHMKAPSGPVTEKLAAEKISPLITSPGTIPTPAAALLLGFLFAGALPYIATSCSSAFAGSSAFNDATVALDVNSIAYVAAGNNIYNLNTVGKVSREQWARFVAYQEAERKADSDVYADLVSWRASGKEPPTFKQNAQILADAQAKVITLSDEVSR